jgi:MFS family permease
VEKASEVAISVGSTLSDLAGQASDDATISIPGLFKSYRPQALIAIMLFSIQQFAGINAIIYFSSEVFRAAGASNPAVASAVVGVANLVGTIVAGRLIDSAGRKSLLTKSLIGMSCSMAVLSFYGTNASTIVAVGGTLVYVLAFAFGAGPVPALLASEVFPSLARGSGVSLAMLTHWVTNVIVGQFFLMGVASCGLSAVYAIFAVVCALGALYINGPSVPETKGKSLDEIQGHFATAISSSA